MQKMTVMSSYNVIRTCVCSDVSSHCIGGRHCSDRQYSDSYILLPCTWCSRIYQSRLFHPWKFGPVFSSPAISTHALWSRVFQSRLFHPCDLVPRFPVLTFPVPRFQSPPFIMYAYACMCLTASHAPSPMSCAKTTEPIEMPYGVCTLMGPINHVVGWSGSPHRNGHFVYKTYFGTPWLAHDDTIETI